MDDFRRQIIILLTFFILTPVSLATSAFSLLIISKPTLPTTQVLASESHTGANIFAALPEEAPSIEVTVTSTDARAEIVRQYLARYNSPLEPYAEYMVNVSDENGLDFRFLAAIAQQESNLCKFAPPETYNCWGWGIHKRGTLGFESYEEAIATVAKGLKENYLDEGYVTVEHIMTKYTPSSPGSWAAGVTQFMAEME